MTESRREEINLEMRAMEPHARLIRLFIKRQRCGVASAIEALLANGVIPDHVTVNVFENHELRRTMYANWKRGAFDDCVAAFR